MANPQYIVIIGCGRLGSLLANTLSHDGHEVVVIDKNPDAFDKLSVNFSGYKITGEAIEQSVLQQADVAQADFFFAVTAHDNINLMVAQIARRIFDVPQVIARIDDPARETIYKEFGIETISPTQLTAEAFMQWMTEQRDDQ